MGNRKLIALDLDGTLLNSEKTISKALYDGLHEAINQDNIIAITTGRSVNSANIVTSDFDLTGKNCFILAFQGNLLYDQEKKKTIFTECLDEDDAIYVMKKLLDAGVYAHTYTEDCLHSPRDCKELQDYTVVTKDPIEFFSDVEELRGLSMPKIIAIDYEDHDKLKRFEKEIADYADGRLEHFFSTPDYLEFVKAGSNKGSGVLKLAELLGIDREDVIAVGDERNDISMIEAAGLGVAMANGREEAKAVADYITENDNNHDGVLEVLKKFVLG